MARGRRTKSVDRSLVEKIIHTIELSGPVESGITALCQKVAEQYNSTPGIAEPLSHSVIYLRIKEWNLTLKTQPGKRGRAAGFGGNKGPRNVTTKAEKFANNPAIVSHHEGLEKVIPERFLPVLEQVKEGSRSAAVKLNCLQCCAFMTAEVRKCTSQGSCTLWAFRPYQGKVEEDEDVSAEVV